MGDEFVPNDDYIDNAVEKDIENEDTIDAIKDTSEYLEKQLLEFDKENNSNFDLDSESLRSGRRSSKDNDAKVDDEPHNIKQELEEALYLIKDTSRYLGMDPKDLEIDSDVITNSASKTKNSNHGKAKKGLKKDKVSETTTYDIKTELEEAMNLINSTNKFLGAHEKDSGKVKSIENSSTENAQVHNSHNNATPRSGSNNETENRPAILASNTNFIPPELNTSNMVKVEQGETLKSIKETSKSFFQQIGGVGNGTQYLNVPLTNMSATTLKSEPVNGLHLVKDTNPENPSFIAPNFMLSNATPIKQELLGVVSNIKTEGITEAHYFLNDKESNVIKHLDEIFGVNNKDIKTECNQFRPNAERSAKLFKCETIDENCNFFSFNESEFNTHVNSVHLSSSVLVKNEENSMNRIAPI